MAIFKLLKNLDDERIIHFLKGDPRASIYHHPAWIKSIIKTFNHKTYYLTSEDSEGNISGLLPFFLMSSPITGKSIVSPPFSTYCDLLIPNDLIPDAVSFIKNRFIEYKKIELRTLKSNFKNYPILQILKILSLIFLNYQIQYKKHSIHSKVQV